MHLILRKKTPSVMWEDMSAVLKKKYQSNKEIIVGLYQLINNNTEINAAWIQ